MRCLVQTSRRLIARARGYLDRLRAWTTWPTEFCGWCRNPIEPGTSERCLGPGCLEPLCLVCHLGRGECTNCVIAEWMRQRKKGRV